MKRSIATVSISGTLPEKLEAIAAAHFTGVEIFENDLLFFTGAPRDVRRYAGDVGLAIELFQPFRDFEGVSDAQLLRNLDRAERKFDLMGELGAPLMLVCSNVATAMFEADSLAADQLAQLAERAARRGLKIGYEALSWGANVHTFDHAWKIVSAANHPSLGLIVDSFHTLALPDDWSDLAKIPGDRIFYVQLADAPRLGMNALTLSRHFRCLPGQGDLDVPGFLQAVIATGYSGPISLEIFNDDFRAAPPRQIANDAMRSLLFLEERVRRREDGAAAMPGARPRRRSVELFDPPLAPVLSGVAFIEFTVDTLSERDLAQLLEQLGFHRIGRHRSKHVTLYAQGDIRLVLNAEPDSFAHSYHLVHGTSVCAMALEADDPQAALGRAEAFGSQRYEGRTGPNEQSIPAIRAIDGSLIYFTRRDGAGQSFEHDFEQRKMPVAATAHLARIDHIAEALREGQLDSSVLFYRSVLGLEPEDVVVIPDPYGLVRSKTVSNADRTIRFPLNISESRNTATARSVTSYAGAGVHHIAFSTGDIFASCDFIRALGVKLLPVPGNYYEDIAARFGLDETLIARLRAGNILYDRQGEGEFFQAYTTLFDNRFFFEIVERRGGYDLYGASNAPVRMAAQAQLNAADAPLSSW